MPSSSLHYIGHSRESFKRPHALHPLQSLLRQSLMLYEQRNPVSKHTSRVDIEYYHDYWWRFRDLQMGQKTFPQTRPFGDQIPPASPTRDHPRNSEPQSDVVGIGFGRR